MLKINNFNDKMISDYLFKGINTVFSSSNLQSVNNHKNQPLTKNLIKANLHTIIRDTHHHNNNQNVSPLKKSRLRSILEKNRQDQLRAVVRRDNSRSPSPYQKISIKNTTSKIEEASDKIGYYRQQRKTMEKSRVLQKSRLGGSNSRIFRVNSQLKMSDDNQLSSTPEKNYKNKHMKASIENIIRF